MDGFGATRPFPLDGSLDEPAGEVLAISPLRGVTLRLDSGEERLFPPDHVNEVRVVDAVDAP